MKTIVLYLCIIFALISGVQPIYGQKLQGIGINAGYLFPVQDVEKGISFELQADMGEVLKYLFMQPSISYTQIDHNQDNIIRNQTLLALGAKFVGYFNSKPNGFYGGLGIYFNRISTEEPDYDSPALKNNIHTKLGISFLTGYLYKFKRVSIYLEPVYNYIYGGFNNLQVKVGFNYII